MLLFIRPIPPVSSKFSPAIKRYFANGHTFRLACLKP